MLSVIEEKTLMLLCVWPGRTRCVLMRALVLDRREVDLAVQALEEKGFVSCVCSVDGESTT